MRIGRFFWKLFHPRASQAQNAPAPTKPPAPTPQQPSGPWQGGSGFDGPMRLRFQKLDGFSAAEKDKLAQAAGVLERVLNSVEFRDAVLSHRFQGKEGYADGSGMTNPQIYQAIRAGKESFEQTADGEADLNLDLRNFSWFQRNVVGYTTESSDTVTLNRRFFSSYTPAEVASNLCHEWLHKLGFEHDFRSTANRPHSVPYAIGDLVEKLAARQLTPLPR
jgi:hypothetical protein